MTSCFMLLVTINVWYSFLVSGSLDSFFYLLMIHDAAPPIAVSLLTRPVIDRFFGVLLVFFMSHAAKRTYCRQGKGICESGLVYTGIDHLHHSIPLSAIGKSMHCCRNGDRYVYMTVINLYIYGDKPSSVILENVV